MREISLILLYLQEISQVKSVAGRHKRTDEYQATAQAIDAGPASSAAFVCSGAAVTSRNLSR